jgi:hypothetical protein
LNSHVKSTLDCFSLREKIITSVYFYCIFQGFIIVYKADSVIILEVHAVFLPAGKTWSLLLKSAYLQTALGRHVNHHFNNSNHPTNNNNNAAHHHPSSAGSVTTNAVVVGANGGVTSAPSSKLPLSNHQHHHHGSPTKLLRRHGRKLRLRRRPWSGELF